MHTKRVLSIFFFSIFLLMTQIKTPYVYAAIDINDLKKSVVKITVSKPNESR